VPIFLAPYLASMMFIKKIDETPFMDVIKVKEARIISKRNRTVHIDGDPFEMPGELVLKVNPASLKVIVP
jgi:diacylglycerol kinase family enzyme